MTRSVNRRSGFWLGVLLCGAVFGPGAGVVFGDVAAEAPWPPRGFITLESAFAAGRAVDEPQWEGAWSGRCFLSAFPDEAAPALFTMAVKDQQRHYGVWGAQAVSGGKPDEAYFDRVTPEHARSRVEDLFNGHAGPILDVRRRPDGTLDAGVEGRMRFEARGLASENRLPALLVRIRYWSTGVLGERAPYADCVFFKKVWPLSVVTEGAAF